MLESDNQRLYAENEQLKFAQRASHPRLLQSSNVITADHALSLQPKPSKVKTLEDEIEGYKRRSSQQVRAHSDLLSKMITAAFSLLTSSSCAPL